MFENYPDILTVKDVCEILHVGKKSVYHLIRTRELPCRRIGRKYRIPKSELLNYMKRN